MIGFEKCKWEHSCGYELCMPEFGKEYEAVPMTNADHIRSMSDEELAWEFMQFRFDAFGAATGNEAALPNSQKKILKWLKLPWKEGEGCFW